MARKVSLVVIWPSFKNKMSYHMSNVKQDYPIKRPYIIAARGSKCENNLKEVMA